jgi:hypothetical protein
MRLGAQLVSLAFALIVFLLVFEMVRRRYLRERYAILWLGAALVLIVLAAWTQLLTTISSAVGIATPSNAFFVIAFAFLLLLLLHFSAVVSRLGDEIRVLAQRVALLEEHSGDPDPGFTQRQETSDQLRGRVGEHVAAPAPRPAKR